MAVKKRTANFKMPTEFNYTIPGDPIPLAKVTDSKGPEVWSEYKQSRFYYVQTVKNIHDTYFPGASFLEGSRNRRQFVDGPIKLEAIFYMRATPSNPEGKLHETAPPTFSLFNFLDHALQGVVYKEDITISSVDLKKIYDENPRTEIKITKLK